VETHAHVLDYLPTGRATERGPRREPVAIALGENELKLLEVVPRGAAVFQPGQRISLLPVEGRPPDIDHVRRRIGYPDLTTSARTELPSTLERIVRAEEARFLRFINESPAVSRRFHLLELLPGIGKKTMQAIVRERGRAPFKSFSDLEERMHLHHPERLIAERIEKELSGADDKYRLFVAP
jgi:putative nucleotide binding protein